MQAFTKLLLFIGLAFAAQFRAAATPAYFLNDTAAQRLSLHLQAPRFLRHGDKTELKAVIVNKSAKEVTAQAQLQLYDGATNTAVDGWFQNIFPVQYFTVAAGDSSTLQFPVAVPYLFTSTLKITATTSINNVNLGDSTLLPVLTDKNTAPPLTNKTKGLQLKRQFFLLHNGGGKPVRKILGDNATIKYGDTVLVQLTVQTPVLLRNVQLADAVCAGVEMLPAIANRNGKSLVPATATKGATRWQVGSLPKGQHVFTATYKAQYTGSFTAASATVQANTSSVVTAASKSMLLNIEQ